MKVLFYLSMLLAVGLLSACSDEENKGVLSNTSWELLGFYSLESNELQSTQPENSKDLYVITFYTDTSFRGRTASNEFEGTYSAKEGLFAVLNCSTTKVGDIYDSDKFYKALLISTHYSISNNQLKLFYNNKQNYLVLAQR